MDLERFIPFLIIYIIWSIITAKLKKKKPDPTAAKPKTSNLVQLLKLIQGQMDPESLAREMQRKQVPQAEEEEVIWEMDSPPIKPPEHIPKEVKTKIVEEVISKPVNLAKKEKEEMPYICRSRHNRRKQKQLKQAIIWKEILDKPLSLRPSQ